MTGIMDYKSEIYSVDLEVFQGPLDLLLYLIKKEEIDIYDIPIARITEQYMKYIEMMKILNLELAGEYILVAATLIRIKARMLLPRDETEGEEMDPRQELVAALLEYKKYKEASEILREKRLLEERVFVPPPANGEFMRAKTVVEDKTTLYDMLSAFKEVLERIGKEQFYEIEPEDMTVEDRILRVLEVLDNRDSATFQELFEDIPRKMVAILTFIAILELTRIHRITVRQSLPFSELRVYRGDQFDSTTPAIEFIKKMHLKQ